MILRGWDPAQARAGASPRADDVDRDATPAAEVVGPLLVWTVAAVAGAWAGAAAGRSLAAPVAAAVADGRAALVLGVAAAVGVLLLGAGAVLTRRWGGAGAVRTGRGERPGTGPTGRGGRAGAAAVLTFVTVAVLAGARTGTHHLGVLPQLAAGGGRVPVTFEVAAEPRPIATGWHVPVEVREVDGIATRERAAVTLTDEHLDGPALAGGPPALGTRWRTTASARPLPDGGYGRWLAQQHLTVALDVTVLGPAGGPGWLAASSEHVRARTRAAAVAAAGPRAGGLLVGLVSGDTRLLPEPDRDAMQATAMTHLTAVSGMHVASVVAGTLGLCALVRAGARTRRLAVAAVVLWFAYLTRFQPSVLRAGTVAAVVLLAATRGVPRDGRHALAGAVLLLVLLDPLLATALGLLLSACAAAGVLVLAPRVRDRLRSVRRLPGRVADVLAITVGAQVAVVPLLLTTFGEVPLASVPANLVAVPLAVVTAAVAFPATVAAALWPPAGVALFAVAGVPARAILAVAHATAGWGGVASLTAPVTAVALAAASAWVVARAGTRASRVTAVVAAVACLAAAWQPLAGRVVPARGATVTAIDVGQGDAFLLRTPGARVLIDAGEDDTAARWLARHGHVRLDLLVITHGHADHVGGARAVLDRVDVAAVWRPPSPGPVGEVAGLDAAAADAAVPVRVVTAQADPLAAPVTAAVGDVQVEVLGPPPGRPYRHAASELNEGSLVLRFTWRDRVALFAGDAELAAQADLLARADVAVATGRGDPLVTGFLALPHHGAGTSDPAFLARASPAVTIASVGADNDYGHPHPRTVAAVEAVGARVHRTDRDGTVTVEVPPPAPAGRSPPTASLGGHGSRPPHRRRRRPAPPARARAGPGRPARAGPRPDRRGARRQRDRPPAGAADLVAVRGAHLRGAARRRPARW